MGLLNFVLFSLGIYTAGASSVRTSLKHRQEGLDVATYDDACNIGYCSINGAYVASCHSYSRLTSLIQTYQNHRGLGGQLYHCHYSSRLFKRSIGFRTRGHNCRRRDIR